MRFWNDLSDEYITFLFSGPKHTTVPYKAIAVIFFNYNRTTVVALCTVSWIERRDAVAHFVEIFTAVLQRYYSLEEDQDTSTYDKADGESNLLLYCSCSVYKIGIWNCDNTFRKPSLGP